MGSGKHTLAGNGRDDESTRRDLRTGISETYSAIEKLESLEASPVQTSPVSEQFRQEFLDALADDTHQEAFSVRHLSSAPSAVQPNRKHVGRWIPLERDEINPELIEEAPDDPMIGAVVNGRYRVVREIGEGGMGRVYEAHHLGLRQPVALKMIHERYAQNRVVRKRFAREAIATSRIKHPNIARAFDYGQLDGGAYIAMELVRGESLHERIFREKIPWRVVCDFGAQIADALQAAHHEGIIHRDLKPENVIVSHTSSGKTGAGKYQVKVLDFGIARVTQTSGLRYPAIAGARGDTFITRQGTVIGTPGYMAPEQAVGEAVNESVDIYALGVILWELLAGRRLFPGDDLTDLVSLQLGEKIPRLAFIRSDIPAALERLILRCLKAKPGSRPKLASSVAAALRAIAKSDGKARDIRRVSPIPKGTHTNQPPESRRWMLLAASFAVLVPMAFGLAIFAGLLPDAARFFGDVSSSSSSSFQSSHLTSLASAPAIAISQTKVDQNIEMLVSGTRKKKRRVAASFLRQLPHESLPQWVRSASDLEIADSCKSMRRALLLLSDADIMKVRPVLDRLAKRPKRGCGKRKRQDCIGCIRPLIDERLMSHSTE